MVEDYYGTLGVRPCASPVEILAAYRRAVRRCHPDLHPDDERAMHRFRQVQTAFEVLNDPARREAYHRSLVSRDGRDHAGFYRPAATGAESTYPSSARYAGAEVSEPVLGLALSTAVGLSLQYLAILSEGTCDAAAIAAAGLPPIFGAALAVPMGVFSCVLGIIVILGAVQMKNLERYRLAVAAAGLATASCLSPWFLLSVPFGIWALIVLRQERVRDAFWS
ncbi:MAG: J domain-containing protein [Pirellulales bacterium]|nr:J domain-containing protein [Pirellulales bacterium]